MQNPPNENDRKIFKECLSILSELIDETIFTEQVAEKINKVYALCGHIDNMFAYNIVQGAMVKIVLLFDPEQDKRYNRMFRARKK